MKILTISGSLRSISINTALLRAVAKLAPPTVQVQHFENMVDLPLFNPELEIELPPTVLALHQAILAADVLIFASPEYAHGVTGVIKNALDWCVSFEGFVNKNVVVLQARARSKFADAALRETLKTMSARIIESASITMPLDASCFTLDAMLVSTVVRETIEQVMETIFLEMRDTMDNANTNR
jgi:chromate reductase